MNVPEPGDTRAPVTIQFNHLRTSAPNGDLQSNARVLDLSTWAGVEADDPLIGVGHGIAIRMLVIRDLKTEMVRFKFEGDGFEYWIDTPVESVEQHLRSMFPAPANNFPTSGFMFGGQGNVNAKSD